MTSALLLLAAVPALAQDATIVRVKGPVSIVAEGTRKAVTARAGSTLLFGDAVKVGKGGIAQISLGERGAVLLREETAFKLEGTPAATRLNVAFGEFLVGLRRKLADRESFRVRTAGAVASVRGTLFWGQCDKASKTTTYAGFGGVVEVTAKGKTVKVEPGKAVSVPFGEAPTEPAASPVTMDYAKKFAVGDSLEGLEALAEKRP